jgi:hypothetical protein
LGVGRNCDKIVVVLRPAAISAAIEARCAGVSLSIGGHCGIPFIEPCGDKLWVNAGVIGMPANDGARRGWYLIVRDSEDDLQFSLHSFDYDSDQAASLMDELNLPCEYASALRTGLWRSMDNLPTEERAYQGAPLSFSPVPFPKLSSANAHFFEGGRLNR